jgi:hypothetical protein
MPDLPEGSVLVLAAASSTITMLVPLAVAVVAAGGGALSHPAVVCREYVRCLLLKATVAAHRCFRWV